MLYIKLKIMVETGLKFVSLAADSCVRVYKGL